MHETGHIRFNRPEGSQDGRSSDGSDRDEERETLQAVPQPPMLVRQPQWEVVAVPLPFWWRLQRRVETMPATSTIWLTLSGALAGVTLERHDESALVTGAGCVLCYLAHRTISKAHRSLRTDIAKEMRLHGPRKRQRGA